MKSSHIGTIWLAAIAIFSMFFGAGNVIFPLQVGLLAGKQIPFALIGLILTAIGGPLLGLIGATMYQGNCLKFFCRPGRAIGLIFIAISLFLLGPFAVIPRCFVVAYASFSAMFEQGPLFFFSLIFGLAALFCCIKQNWVLPILGKFFSPILLLSLICIIAFGIATGSSLEKVSLSSGAAFTMGLHIGFDTMDLIAAIFFSSSIWMMLFIRMKQSSEREIVKTAMRAGIIGGVLLGLIYIGLALATAYHATEIGNCPPEKLMARLALLTLGSFWGNMANIAIAIACFTTVVSLTQTIGSLCHREFFPRTLSYRQFLITIIAISILFSNLGFSMICNLIHPVITICYPAIIILTFFNLIHKKYGFIMIRRPVYGTLLSSLIYKSILWIGRGV